MKRASEECESKKNERRKSENEKSESEALEKSQRCNCEINDAKAKDATAPLLIKDDCDSAIIHLEKMVFLFQTEDENRRQTFLASCANRLFLVSKNTRLAMALARFLSSEGFAIGRLHRDDKTLLMKAIEHRNLELIDYWITVYQAKIQTTHYPDCFWRACKRQDIEIMKILYGTGQVTSITNYLCECCDRALINSLEWLIQVMIPENELKSYILGLLRRCLMEPSSQVQVVATLLEYSSLTNNDVWNLWTLALERKHPMIRFLSTCKHTALCKLDAVKFAIQMQAGAAIIYDLIDQAPSMSKFSSQNQICEYAVWSSFIDNYVNFPQIGMWLVSQPYFELSITIQATLMYLPDEVFEKAFRRWPTMLLTCVGCSCRFELCYHATPLDHALAAGYLPGIKRCVNFGCKHRFGSNESPLEHEIMRYAFHKALRRKLYSQFLRVEAKLIASFCQQSWDEISIFFK